MSMFELPPVADIVAEALAEDLGVERDRFDRGADGDPKLLERDVTTSSVIDEDARFKGLVVAREHGVVCGLPVADEVFSALSRAAGLFEPIEFFPLVAEGSAVEPGTPVAEVEGLALAVLAAERSALDFIMVLSGIATETSRWANLAGGGLKVCDTRKTVPGMRALSKYAVRVGGGTNHRTGLFDMVLIKDNHLKWAGGIEAAVGRARLRHPRLLIEVEADTVEQAVRAVAAGADYVLLDNMDDIVLGRAVSACRAAAEKRGIPVVLEVSGNVERERLERLVSAGVDRVSSSALTMAPPLDFGLDES
jgi:nicotinate-nucleotide pyrophosphorylase (carboxylating)